MNNPTILLFSVLIALSLNGFSQSVLLSEDFENGTIPSGWTQQTNASDNGWKFGTANFLSSDFWEIPSHTKVAATNDDECNCTKNNDLLISPTINLSNNAAAFLKVDIFFLEAEFNGITEIGSIEISANGGSTFSTLEILTGQSNWYTHQIDLSVYAGQSNVKIAFKYNDSGGYLYGFAIDNVIVYEPFSVNAALSNLDISDFILIGSQGKSIKGTISNVGINTITSVNVNYSVDNGQVFTDQLTGLSIARLSDYDFEHTQIWNPSTAGTYNLKVWIDNVNGAADMDNSNDTVTLEIEASEGVPNIIDSYLTGNEQYEVIGNAQDGVADPTDLDFHPLYSNQLWVVNEGTENSGGSSVIFTDAGKPTQDAIQRQDGNAWHFMSLPSAMAFGENGNWATSPGVQDANHTAGGTFTGPTLWSGDLNVYAMPSGGNGSHLDMVHKSPYAMGIAHEINNAYWIFDSWNNDIVRYDFMADHGPGNDYHGDAKVHRYKEITVNRVQNIPSHMVIEKNSGWLYIADTYNKRILRLDTKSGNKKQNLPQIPNPVDEYWEMENLVWEVFYASNLNQPSGIDVVDDRLIVSDHATGDIIIYDTNTKQELGRIQTGATEIMGIKIGPSGFIWYVDHATNQVKKIEPDSVILPTAVFQPSIDDVLNIYPNPSNGIFTIELKNSYMENALLSILDVLGRTIYSESVDAREQLPLDLSYSAPGILFVRIEYGDKIMTKKIMVDH